MLSCAIIDDEPLAAELLASYATKIPFITLTGTFNSAIEAMKDLRANPVDLLFLDIQMPELSGLEFATILPLQTMVVFTTAFDKYAVDSYKVNCIDYLLKPISFDAFLHAADKAQQRMESTPQTIVSNTQRQTSNVQHLTPNTSRPFIYVKSDYKLQRIFLDEILYIEGLKDYVNIHLTPLDASQKSRHILALMNMKSIEENLPSPEFLRIHRSFIVHMPLADAVERQRIVFRDNYLPISDSYKDTVQKYISDHTIF